MREMRYSYPILVKNPKGREGLEKWISEKYFVNNAEWIEVA
jgi:hypothetical protein